MLLCVFLFFRGFNFSLRKGVKNIRKMPPLAELGDFIQENTPPWSLIYRHRMFERSLPRRARREVFVDYKFVPAGGVKLYEWYVRMEEKAGVYEDFRRFEALRKKYGVDYIVSMHPVRGLAPHLLFANDTYYLYDLDGS